MFTILVILVALSTSIQGQASTEIQNFDETKEQILNQINITINQINSYVVQFLELLVRIVQTITEFTEELQNTNVTTTYMKQLTLSIKKTFNYTTDNCTLQQEESFQVLTSKTSEEIQECYENVTLDFQEFIPKVEYFYNKIIDSIKNISDGISDCFKNNPLIYGLPGCLVNEKNLVNEEYNTLLQIFEDVKQTGLKIYNEFVIETKTCGKPIAKSFVYDFMNVLTDYISCIST